MDYIESIATILDNIRYNADQIDNNLQSAKQLTSDIPYPTLRQVYIQPDKQSEYRDTFTIRDRLTHRQLATIAVTRLQTGLYVSLIIGREPVFTDSYNTTTNAGHSRLMEELEQLIAGYGWTIVTE